MDPEVYNEIVSHVRRNHGLSHTCMKQLVKLFPKQSYDTLFSILSLEYQKRMKYNHVRTQRNKAKYWELYSEGVKNRDRPGIIIRIAEHFDVAPCLVAKLVLSQYFEKTENPEEIDLTTLNVNVYLRDTTLIPDMSLASEVFLCTLYDNIYSPLTEAMRSSLGQQYEVKLYREVIKLGLGFRDEEHLRKYGYDKTPDCKLEVPVMIDGLLVNWIESKALFGDEDVHKDYTKNQYLSYWNRFGPGLVIYWFGYLRTIVEPNDKRFTIRDHLPQNMIQMSPPDFDMDKTSGVGI